MVARHDLITDPRIRAELADERLGQAYFSRKLNELDNEAFAEPSLLPGWSKAHVIAHVGYNARAITRLVEWAETGVESPMYPSMQARDEEIAFGATLATRALRHLSDHAAVTLDVAWRDLPPERWSFPVRTSRGREVPVSETVWMRTREVWLHAIDLGNGGRFADVPERVARRLLADITGSWQARGEAGQAGAGFILHADDTGDVFDASGGSSAPQRLHGSLRDLLGWASGRRPRVGTADAPPAPRWL